VILDGRIKTIFYYLVSGLKTGDLCINNSEEFADYREQLLPWEECEPLVSDFCAEMDLKKIQVNL
jgi:hypothetical protein